MGMVRECLQRWAARNQADPSSVAFFMCFFVNNQYRILEASSPSVRLCKASDNLEVWFHEKLCRIGKMVALVDTYDRPMYLTRIWTIFEQFKAMELHLQVEMVMPEEASSALIKELERGECGISRVGYGARGLLVWRTSAPFTAHMAFRTASATSFLTAAVRHAFGSHAICTKGIVLVRARCRARPPRGRSEFRGVNTRTGS